MNVHFAGAQGAKEFFYFPARILTAIFVCILSLSGASAQGNPSFSNGGPNDRRLQSGPAAPVQLEGELEIIYQDLKGGQSRLLHTLKLSNGNRVPLRFVDQPPTDLLNGQHVLASGQLSGGSLILYSGSTATTTVATTTASTAPLPNTLGAQSTAVILVNFQDAPSNQPWTPAQVQTDVFGSAGLNGYLEEASYGQTSVTGAVYGWYVIPVSSTTCDTSQITTAANNAASAAGANLASYTHLFYVFPYNSVCGWAGAATIGGSPSQSWINGGSSTANTLDQGVLAHEMGHNLGLFHSHGLGCGSVVFLGGQCTVREYGDTFDVMGATQGHYTAFQKERLGWLNYGASPAITTATTSGTYTIAPYETADSSSKALKVLKFANQSTGLSYYYYIEYRQPFGFDSFISSLADQNETSGVVVHLVLDGSPNSGNLLNMTPNSSSLFDWNDVALVVGATYSDPDAGLSITPQSVGSGATVNVSISQPSCVRTLPGISISPSQPAGVSAGTTVTYTITVTNNDSSSCGTSTFNLQPLITYGWTDTLSGSALTLSPGSSSSATLAVTSAANSNDGTDPLGITATNAADLVYTASASATYSVGIATPPPPPPPSLAVSVAVAGASFTPPTTVPISATVTNNGSPASSASVTFTVTTPSGNTATQTATTGSSGIATWNYKLNSKSPAGVYSVVAQASLSSTTSGGKKGAGGATGAAGTVGAAGTGVTSSNTTSFNVQ